MWDHLLVVQTEEIDGVVTRVGVGNVTTEVVGERVQPGVVAIDGGVTDQSAGAL